MRRGVKLFIFQWIGLVVISLYYYDAMTLLGMVCLITSHELGHYIFSLWENAEPRFIISHTGNIGVRSTTPSVCISMAGLLVNFLLIPLISAGSEIEWWGWVMIVICASSKDIGKTRKMLEREIDK